MEPTKASLCSDRLQYIVTHTIFTKNIPTPYLVGIKVFDIMNPVSPFEEGNTNPFCALFGIAFQLTYGTRWIRAFSRFEYGKCFGLSTEYNKLISRRKKSSIIYCHSCPGITMEQILNTFWARLIIIWDSNISTNIPSDQSPVAPAATTFTILNDSVSTKLPSPNAWMKA